MNILTNPEFFVNELLMRLTLSTSDEGFEIFFKVDTGRQQRFTLWLAERAEPDGDSTEVWSVYDDRTYKENRWPAQALHEGLRSFIASVLPELMLRGFILEGSYEYDGRAWEINPHHTIESFALPEE